jgi:serine/threonine protein kinase
MSVSTKGEFFRLLKRSALLSPEKRVEAKHLCQGVPDATQASNVLVQHNLLTEWQAAQLLLGRTQFFLGKYKLLKFRGRGAMGIVFKAQHPDFDRSVAIKVLPKSIVDRPRSVARFLREIRSTAALNHPNLVVAYDADEIDGTYCLVMEYVTGRSLKMLLQQFGRLPPVWSCECMYQAALALQHIHDCDLVHRDVKPSNLLVTTIPPDPRPVVKVLDIGLARFVSEVEEEGALTRAGQIVGTGNYMAPEQVADARNADIRADIYGLGVTFFELLTGTCPLAGQTLVQTYMNRLRNEPPRVSTLCPNVPRGLDTVLDKMLKRDLAERYQTPAALAADLSAILEGRREEEDAPFFAEIPPDQFPGDEPNCDASVGANWRDPRVNISLPSDPTLSADATVPTDNASGPVPFAIEAPWPPMRFDSSGEMSVVGSADGSTAQPSGDPAADSSVVEFLQLLDNQSDDVFRQIGQRYAGGTSRGKLPELAAQSSQFLRQLVKGLAGKARSKGKKRVAPKSGATPKPRTKSKTEPAPATPKARRRKSGPHPKTRKPGNE